LEAHASWCAGASVPFDESEIDRVLGVANTLNALASGAGHIIFDLYEHCALMVRFFVLEDGTPRLISTSGDQRLAPRPDALRADVIRTGQQAAAPLGRPAGFRLLVEPLREGDAVIGLLEFVVPADLVDVKAAALRRVLQEASSSLRACRAATEAQSEARRAAGTSFALGLRLAGVVSRAGELGAAVRSAVDLLARELKTPVVAWRVDRAGAFTYVAASSGLANGQRRAIGAAADLLATSGHRKEFLEDLKAQAGAALRGEVTVMDCGSVVFVARGRHAELERCGPEVGSLLDQLPVANLVTVRDVDDGTVAWEQESLDRTRLRDLTPRENEILAMLAAGRGTTQIARQLVISEKTVKTHVQNILRKLDVTSRLEAAAVAVRAGFVPLSAS
jgi:DNA-binding CsgD family transcriptional regulator